MRVDQLVAVLGQFFVQQTIIKATCEGLEAEIGYSKRIRTVIRFVTDPVPRPVHLVRHDLPFLRERAGEVGVALRRRNGQRIGANFLASVFSNGKQILIQFFSFIRQCDAVYLEGLDSYLYSKVTRYIRYFHLAVNTIAGGYPRLCVRKVGLVDCDGRHAGGLGIDIVRGAEPPFSLMLARVELGRTVDPGERAIDGLAIGLHRAGERAGAQRLAVVDRRRAHSAVCLRSDLVHRVDADDDVEVLIIFRADLDAHGADRSLFRGVDLRNIQLKLILICDRRNRIFVVAGQIAAVCVIYDIAVLAALGQLLEQPGDVQQVGLLLHAVHHVQGRCGPIFLRQFRLADGHGLCKGLCSRVISFLVLEGVVALLQRDGKGHLAAARVGTGKGVGIQRDGVAVLPQREILCIAVPIEEGLCGGVKGIALRDGSTVVHLDGAGELYTRQHAREDAPSNARASGIATVILRRDAQGICPHILALDIAGSVNGIRPRRHLMAAVVQRDRCDRRREALIVADGLVGERGLVQHNDRIRKAGLIHLHRSNVAQDHRATAICDRAGEIVIAAGQVAAAIAALSRVRDLFPSAAVKFIPLVVETGKVLRPHLSGNGCGLAIGYGSAACPYAGNARLGYGHIFRACSE